MGLSYIDNFGRNFFFNYEIYNIIDDAAIDV